MTPGCHFSGAISLLVAALHWSICILNNTMDVHASLAQKLNTFIPTSAHLCPPPPSFNIPYLALCLAVRPVALHLTNLSPYFALSLSFSSTCMSLSTFSPLLFRSLFFYNQ